MLKKLFSIFAALTLSVGLWAETVSYRYPVYNEGGVSKGIKEWKTTTVDATVVASSSSQVTWNSGWYVVKGEVTLDKGAVCNGDVHLILADGAKLTAKGYGIDDDEIYYAGIQVENDGVALTIYGQSANPDEMGALIATGAENTAGIGGGGDVFMMSSHDLGNITINGGKVTATGKKSSAGIGISSSRGPSSSSTITINGGIVTATCSSTYSNKDQDGICNGPSGHIYINGGEITAQGGKNGCGIGESMCLIINDGTITAKGGEGAAGITVGARDANAINGGTVTANGGKGAAGIGGWGPYLTINGGTVTANGGNGAVGIGGGQNPYDTNIIINGGTVTANGGEGAAGFGSGSPVEKYNLYISDAYVLKAGASADPTTVIAHTSAQNMASTLTQRYVKMEGLATPYTRPVTANQWGTVCLPYAATSFSGVTFYKVNYYDASDPSDMKLYIEEVSSLDAGMPYIFEATATGTLTINHSATAPMAYSEAGNERGLYGSFARATFAYAIDHAYAAIANNAVNVIASGYITIPACRAYLDMDEVPTTEQPHSAPLRRIGGPRQTPTGEMRMENGEMRMENGKFLRNNQLIIIRDGKTYNAQGAVIIK